MALGQVRSSLVAARDQPLGFLQSLSALQCPGGAVALPPPKPTFFQQERALREALLSLRCRCPPISHVTLPGWAAAEVQASEALVPVHSSPPPCRPACPALLPIPAPLGAAQGLGVGGGWSSPGLL